MAPNETRRSRRARGGLWTQSLCCKCKSQGWGAIRMGPRPSLQLMGVAMSLISCLVHRTGLLAMAATFTGTGDASIFAHTICATAIILGMDGSLQEGGATAAAVVQQQGGTAEMACVPALEL